MTEPLLVLVLLGAVAAVSFGGARVVSWLLDRRERTALQRFNESLVIELAKAEIAATKRGDLLAAAHYVEQQEGAHVP